MLKVTRTACGKASPPSDHSNSPLHQPLTRHPLLAPSPSGAEAVQSLRGGREEGRNEVPTLLMSLSSSSCCMRKVLALCRRFWALSLATSSRSLSFLLFLHTISFCFMIFLRLVTASYGRQSGSVGDCPGRWPGYHRPPRRTLKVASPVVLAEPRSFSAWLPPHPSSAPQLFPHLVSTLAHLWSP